jgi:hypothetical protein
MAPLLPFLPAIISAAGSIAGAVISRGGSAPKAPSDRAATQTVAKTVGQDRRAGLAATDLSVMRQAYQQAQPGLKPTLGAG